MKHQKIILNDPIKVLYNKLIGVRPDKDKELVFTIQYPFSDKFYLAYGIHQHEYNLCSDLWKQYLESDDEQFLELYKMHKMLADINLKKNIQILTKYKVNKNELEIQSNFKQIFGIFISECLYLHFKYTNKSKGIKNA
jgi:hypothetical protein